MTEPALYLVATPIGNLDDMSARAIKTLNEVDFIAAEDTRNSIKLLNRYDIKKPLISYFEYNKKERGEQIVKRLLDGESCALITDAGMPAISDPGEDLVRLCHENGITVSVIPGANAAVSAIAVSGLFTGRFCFEGFLSTSTKSRLEHLDNIKDEKRTMIFYEAPHKLKKTLADFKKTLGNRKIALARELTKLHEEIIVTTLDEAIEKYNTTEPRGEFVLVIEGRQDVENETNEITEEGIIEKVNEYIENDLSKSDAIKAAAEELKLRKNEVYRIFNAGKAK